jgi:hypothetical protein
MTKILDKILLLPSVGKGQYHFFEKRIHEKRRPFNGYGIALH